MVFSSLTFLCVFLPVVFVLQFFLPSIHLKNGLLVIASLVFYAYGEPVYILLMLGSTLLNYGFGRWLAWQRRKSVLALAVCLNLLLLGVWKYGDMICLTINELLQIDLPRPGLALPVGISFYTFQAISYVVDVYRGEVKAQKHYGKVLLYISFFPQLIAGPIVKYHDIEAQISDRTLQEREIAEGLRRFIVGLSKKVLLANVMAQAADQLFSIEVSQMNLCCAWLGAIAYMLQIYYDFSGYSDMAIGLGHMFGFTFQENFRYPYEAVTIQHFWRKWHISLSTWFREYLYIPLGGNRKGKVRTWRNKLIVFFCTGLWHGASWTFVLWGLYHGAFLLLEDILPIRKLPKCLGHVYTLVIVCVGFVMFRAETVTQGFGMIGKMFTGFSMADSALALRQCTPLFLFCLVVGVGGMFSWHRRWSGYARTKAGESISYLVALGLLLLCVLQLSGGTYNPFIYFRF